MYARQWTAAPEDVVQEAFVKLSQQKATPERVVAWLYRVVRNEAISRARAEQRRKKHESIAATRSWFVVADDTDGAAVTSALESLPAEEREMIVLHLWGGLTFAEIAAIVGSSASSVHRGYVAGIQRLRERLDVPCPNETKT